MALYLILPKITLLKQSASLAFASFRPADREKRVKEIEKLRKADANAGQVTEAVRDHKGKFLTDKPQPATGVRFAELSPDGATKLAAELPDHRVVPDKPIELIPPFQRATLQSRKSLKSGDDWHLAAIGLKAARAKGFKGTGKGVTVAVLDTGAEAGHPELGGRVI